MKFQKVGRRKGDDFVRCRYYLRLQRKSLNRVLKHILKCPFCEYQYIQYGVIPNGRCPRERNVFFVDS